MSKSAPKRGPGGSLHYATKPSRVPGVPRSDKARRAAAHRAANPGALTIRNRKLAKKVAGFDVPAVVEAFTDAICEGDSQGVDRLAVRALADLEGMRRGLADDVNRRGVVLKETVVSPVTGETVGERLRVHPGVEVVSKLSTQLGFTSEARRLDPRSKGEGNRDDAFAAALKRDEFLRGRAGQALLPAPPPDDEPVDAEYRVGDVEVVPEP